jgi:hypothetical protein
MFVTPETVRLFPAGSKVLVLVRSLLNTFKIPATAIVQLLVLMRFAPPEGREMFRLLYWEKLAFPIIV